MPNKRTLPPILPPLCAALATAALLWSAMPPLDESSAGWFALVPLLLLTRHATPRTALRYAWLGGMVYWCASLLWLWRLIGNGGPLILVLLGQFLLSAYLALYWALFATASAWLWQKARHRHRAWRIPLVLLADPLLWCGTEYLRGVLLTGFPWTLLGVTVSHHLAAIQVASLGGVHLVSAIVLLVNGGIASLLQRAAAPLLPAPPPRRGFDPIRSLESLLPLTLALACWAWGLATLHRATARERAATPQTHDTWVAGLVQPNTPSIFEIDDAIILRQRAQLDRLTRQLAGLRPDFILWPESAILGTLSLNSSAHDPAAALLARSAARDTRIPLMTGCGEIRFRAPHYKVYDYFNAIWHFDSSGAPLAQYHKQHLVPFGEYILGANLLPLLNKLTPTGFPCTPGNGPVTFFVPDASGLGRPPLPLSPQICFEDIFPHLSRASIRAGGRVLLNATNDAWFDGSHEPELHLRQARFRAVETRSPMLRATNTGVTCAIDAFGRIDRLTDATGSSLSFPGFMTSRLLLPKDFTPPPYTRHGDLLFAWPATAFLLLTCAAVAWQRIRHATGVNN